MSRVLLFAEDPAAAQFVADLPADLSRRRVECTTLCAGLAIGILAARGSDATPVAPGADAGEILAACRPRVVVVGTAENPDTLGLRLIDAARKRGIPSVGCVDAPPRASDRFRGRTAEPLRHAPDWLLVADAATAEAFVALGFPASAVIETGNPHFDYVLRKRSAFAGAQADSFRARVAPGAPADRRVVVFVSGGSQRLRGRITPSQFDGYTLHGRGTYRGRSEVVMEEFLDAVARLDPPVHTILRPHPKDVAADYGPLVEEFDAYDAGTDALDLVAGADLVVGSSTLLLLEAALLGRPTLSIVPRAGERSWLATTRSGVTPCVATRQDLDHVFPALLEAVPVPLETLLASRTVTPGASDRVLEAVLRVLHAPAASPVASR